MQNPEWKNYKTKQDNRLNVKHIIYTELRFELIFLSHIDWYITTINHSPNSIEKNMIKCMNELCYNLDSDYFSSLKGYSKYLVSFRPIKASVRDLLELCDSRKFL